MLNRKRGRIPNEIKRMAIECVNKYGLIAFHYACYDCSFNDDEECINFDYPFIDCIYKELKRRGF